MIRKTFRPSPPPLHLPRGKGVEVVEEKRRVAGGIFPHHFVFLAKQLVPFTSNRISKECGLTLFTNCNFLSFSSIFKMVALKKKAPNNIWCLLAQSGYTDIADKALQNHYTIKLLNIAYRCERDFLTFDFFSFNC